MVYSYTTKHKTTSVKSVQINGEYVNPNIKCYLSLH